MAALRCINAACFGLCVAALPALADDAPITNLSVILSDVDCAQLACREAATASVVGKDGKESSLAVPRSPYVTKAGTIVVFPGEAMAVDFPSARGEVFGAPHYYSPIVDGTIAKPGKQPKPIVAVSVGRVSLGQSGHMALQLSGIFGRGVTFDITSTQIGSDGLVATRTETCVLPRYQIMPNMNIPPGVPGPFLVGNFRPWADEAAFNRTHDAALAACHFAEAPPAG